MNAIGRLLRLEDKLAAYRARQEAASRWAWLAPMLPRLLGAPPSPGLWGGLYGDGWLRFRTMTENEIVLALILLDRQETLWQGEHPTFADLWHDMIRFREWDVSQPPDAFIPQTDQEYEDVKATRPDLAAWWDACPFSRAVLWWTAKGDEPDPEMGWAAELRARLTTGESWFMAEVKDERGAVVKRFPWPRPDAPDRLEAARLAERALEVLDALSTAAQPQTLEEVKEWLERL